MMESITNITEGFHSYLTQSVAEGFLMLDGAGKVMSANQMASSILGYENSSLIGLPIQAIWGEDNVAWATIQKQDSACEEIKLRHRNGRFIPVSLNISIIPIPSGGSNTLLAITDLENARQLNESLSRTQRLASIGTLTASVAHELNTPVSIIAATCSNLRHEIEDNSLGMEQLLTYIDMIEQSTWRSARILEVLRNYSYNDAPEFTITNLNLIVADALTLVRHQFRGEFHIDIHEELDKSLRTFMCDHNRITQVILNLMNNASDAVDPGGQVTIRSWIETESTPLQQNGAENSSLATNPEYYVFSVSDSGHGIDPHIMDRIFDPFFTTKTQGKGTGLGLYIAKHIIEQHNGRITAKNNPEGGATFTVLLPRKQESINDQ